ncbi:MAG: glutamate racemase [Elusimicrobia bacterium]|nr:glutamate racemase [Elusimicrobiota bacterium]
MTRRHAPPTTCPPAGGASRKPIGVFDSGIGGLTVFDAIARRMPAEDLVYFGDTAHVPYGTKSPDAVGRYSSEVARHLDGVGIKALVVACNTASAVALPKVRRSTHVPVIGVILPGARAAAAASGSGSIGIIGTEATISSGAYTRAVGGLRPGARVTGAACPLFVPLVEEGWWDHPVTETVARHYLGPMKRAGVDSLILGCTHYPLLRGVVGRVMGKGVTLIDSAAATAVEIRALLRRIGLERTDGKGRHRFIVSDGPERFRRLARRLIGRDVEVRCHRFDL